MASFNKLIIMGRLGRDPELREFTGSTLCSFPVATSEKWSGSDGSKQERTTWHDVKIWGKQAENCAQYLKKGSQVLVEGSVEIYEYEKDGEKRRSYQVAARNVQFISTPKLDDDDPPF